MLIQIDSREKARAIKKILETFEKQQVEHLVSKLPYGDYMNYDNPRLVIDRKQNLGELVNNLLDEPEKDKFGYYKRYDDGTPMTPRRRFFRELEGAQKHGIKMIILCEHGRNVKNLDDVAKWENPRLKVSPMAMSGERLQKLLIVISKKYDVDFVFCEKHQTGKRIIELLGGERS